MKHHSFLTYVALSLALLWGGSSVWQFALADAISEGVALYKAHNYTQAAQKLEAGLKTTPNPKGVFYLGMSYTHLNRLEQAQDTFNNVLQMVPADSELAIMARNNINYLIKQSASHAPKPVPGLSTSKASKSQSTQANSKTH